MCTFDKPLKSGIKRLSLMNHLIVTFLYNLNILVELVEGMYFLSQTSLQFVVTIWLIYNNIQFLIVTSNLYMHNITTLIGYVIGIYIIVVTSN